jgi:2-keto-4-pentenoate hydratase/2-oxohepta-3-ene-1,7-dioic acid hydratase in catechol pathway
VLGCIAALVYPVVSVRLATFSDGSEARVGVVVGEEVVDLSVAAPAVPRTMVELLVAGGDALEQARAATENGAGRVPLSSVTLRAPIPNPSKFLAIGLNYRAHAKEMGRTEALEAPTVFAKMPSCVAGPYDDVVLPYVSEQLDYEGELGFVIGRRCRHVTRDRAHQVVAGFVVLNDVSVRDWQRATTQWTLGKSFDTHGPMGPWLVTADELDDPHRLSIRTLVNGEVRQDSSTSALIHDCYALIEHLSKVCTLEPGDVVATGTPAGVAAGMDPPRWLAPGDVVRVEIEGVGAIENRIVAEPPPSDGPP